MNLKSSVLSRELKSSLWIIFVLTLIFGFNDGRDSFVFSSWIGLLVLITSTAIGLIPGITKIQRTHSMACLMVPVIIYLI